ncbi:hypothetical protein VTK73DRAFT_9419 [Phialemonium thermophilum]|uniref:Uncharacterized protein n=1 Tax=Phialemonium thermophilum TaxID=223376 RepID=A0ABR3W2C9_9PEZI
MSSLPYLVRPPKRHLCVLSSCECQTNSLDAHIAPTASAEDANPPRDDQVDVHLAGAPETLLLTLYGKWQHFHSERPILDDRWVATVMERIGNREALGGRLRNMPMMASQIATRALT